VYRIHNQSTIHKDSDWTSSRAKEFYLKLRSISKNASEEMRLKKCVWSNGSEEELLKTRHQKQCHQKQWSSEAYLVRSYFTRVDKGQCTKCTTTNSATTISATLSLHQDKDNSNIAADVVPFVMEWIWN